jgi:hypothetical protein
MESNTVSAARLRNRRRRREGRRNKTPKASPVPPTPRRMTCELARALVVGAVESIASRAVPGEVPLMVIDPGVTAQVIGSMAPAGELVTAQEALTAPAKPPKGVIVSVEVLPVVAPAVRVIGALLARAMPGVSVTLTWLVADAETVPVAASVPVMVTT